MNLLLGEKESVLTQMYKFLNLKTLLNIEDSENITLNSLITDSNKILNKNYLYLVSLYQYINTIPLGVKYKISTAADLLKDDVQFFDELRTLKETFITDAQFSIFAQNIFKYIVSDIMGDKDFKSISNDELNEKYSEYRVITNLLIFSIINSNSSNIYVYDTSDFIYNLFLLYNWEIKNKHKPIEELNEDECNIISTLIYGMDATEVVNLNLCDSIEKVEELISVIPAKFHVDNIAQAIYRIILLNPSIWTENEHKSLVRAIKNIKTYL